MTDPCAIDRAMRQALLDAAACDSATVHGKLAAVLGRPPHRDRAAIVSRFGDTLPRVQAAIGPLVDRLELAIEGPVSFKRWCEVTGFGDDVGLMQVFLDWSQVTSRGVRFSPAIRRGRAH